MDVNELKNSQFENDNLIRCFYHELGHYFADYYNHKHFGTADIEKIEFIHRKEDDEYSGGISVVKPKDYSINKVINLPERLATLVYGCIFQSLKTNGQLMDCFGLGFEKNGKNDYEQFIWGLKQFDINNDEIKYELFEFFNKYTESLRNSLNELFEVTMVENLLIKTVNGFEVNIQELKKKFDIFIKLHEQNYLDFINEIREVINWKVSTSKLISINQNKL